MQQININVLKPHPQNNEFFDDLSGDEFERLKNSIRDEKIYTDILVSPDMTIISGHQRVRAAKELGMTLVPIKIDEDLQDEDSKLRALISNNFGRRKNDPAKDRKALETYVSLRGYKQGRPEKKSTMDSLTLDEITKELNLSKTNLKRALSIERNLTDSMKEFKSGGLNMDLNTKFDVKQKVFVIHNHSTHKKEICPICDGKGIVFCHCLSQDVKGINRKTFICPDCHGNKFVYRGLAKIYKVEENVITGIKISIREKSGLHISYKVKANNRKGEMSYPENENMIFETEQEAYTVCDKLNQDSDFISDIWHDKYDYSKVDVPIIVRDKSGREYNNHSWVGHAYYVYVGNDGYRSDVDISEWRYKD